MSGGERGIRTLDTLLTYTHFPGVLLQPLGHLSGTGRTAYMIRVALSISAPLVCRVAMNFTKWARYFC